jgi:branched-chain amino acid transport system substrate-binding protein
VTVVPYRIGVCQDWALGPHLELWYNGLTLALEEAFEQGIVDRPIEIVLREVEGPPRGQAAGVINAWRELAFEEQVLAIVGPHITDMNMIIRDEVERGEVPTISHCATIYFDGEYCFQLPNGTFMDETYLIAEYLADRRRVRSVGVMREDNPIGVEYFDFFRQHCKRLGVQVTSDQIVPPVIDNDDMRRSIEAIRASGAEAIAHLGFGTTFGNVVEVMGDFVRDGWDVPRVTITTWVGISGATSGHEMGFGRAFGAGEGMFMGQPWSAFEGWVGVDLPHEGNRVFRQFLDTYEKRFGTRVFNCYPAHFYDIGRVLAEAIARARPVTPKGVKRALEQVRMLPAAMGGPGTTVSFGPYDHRGYKGRNYLVLRTIRNGEEGLVELLDPAYS